MSADVIPFSGKTVLSTDPVNVLSSALTEKMEHVIVLGWLPSGKLYSACSSSDLPIAMWLVERGRHHLNQLQDENEKAE